MSADFEDFARAAASVRGSFGPEITPFQRVAVLGGGPDARLLAALSLAAGCAVTLFSAYGRELDLMRSSSGIGLRGAGPVGTYHVDQGAHSVRLTAELDAAVQDAEVIFLTGPVHKQRTYAMVLADHLADGQVLVIAPGRSLGAAETAWNLRLGGCSADVTLVEVQGLPFWYRAEGANLHLGQAGAMAAAVLPSGRADVLSALGAILPNVSPVASILESGFSDLSAAVDIPALVLGGAGLAQGGVSVPMGATALPENQTFAALIGDDQRRLIEVLAGERRQVAAGFGVRSLPETSDWIATYTGAARGADARPVPDQATARTLMRDGVIGSLVPLISAATSAGIDVPKTQAIVALTETILDADVAASGRRLETMGLNGGPDDVRRALTDMRIGER
ncbi:MAG: hypothetical protein AB8B71_07560 [Paracoccaceae bacterium]